MALTAPDDFRAIPGKGIEARVKGARIAFGNAAMMEEAGVFLRPERQRCSKTPPGGADGDVLAVDGSPPA